MGGWNPKPGTIYRTLLDQCRTVFGIQGLAAPSGHECYGSSIGCRCHWVANDFSVYIHTPQMFGASFYGRSGFPAQTADVRAWLRGERFWDRTTGVLRVTRVARQSAAHLDWADFARISDGFSLALSSEVVRDARAVMERMIAQNEWFEPVRRRDGGYDLEAASGTPRRPVRRVSIRTAAAEITVGECIDAMAMSVFEAPPGYCLDPSAFPQPHGSRLEVFQYEFKLLGRNSFEFQIASQ